jgi:hypothetical protein
LTTRAQSHPWIQGQQVVRFADVQLQALRMRDRIHVESLGQPPALARHQHVEHDARPQLTQVGVRLRAVDHQDTGDLQVTGTGGGLVIIAFQGEAGRLQCPQLAERGRSEAVPVGVDGDRCGPGSVTPFMAIGA